MAEGEKLSFKKFVSGPFDVKNYLKLVVFLICAGVVFSVGFSIWHFLFPKKPQATSTTSVGTVQAGGTATITNINNPLPDLKQGVYLRGASDRASLGVFREVNRMMDVEIGGGKDFDGDVFGEVSVRIKF